MPESPVTLKRPGSLVIVIPNLFTDIRVGQKLKALAPDKPCRLGIVVSHMNKKENRALYVLTPEYLGWAYKSDWRIVR
jgi:hypothetical protein